ncbi:MAG: hypothetical protein WC418_02945 [Candidatus Omnitrophota bacterium]|jgi:hypothetical protein
MKAINVILATAAFFLTLQPTCKADNLVPFSNNNSSGTVIPGSDSSNGFFLIPVYLGKGGKRDGSQTTTTTTITSAGTTTTTIITSPQINIQSVPEVSVLTGEDYIVTTGVNNSNPQVNDMTKSAAQQSGLDNTLVLENPDLEQQPEEAVSSEAGVNLVEDEADGGVAVRNSAIEDQLSGEGDSGSVLNSASGVKTSEEIIEGYVVGKAEVDFIQEQGSSQPQGEDKPWLNGQDDASYLRDRLRIAYQAGGAEKVVAAAQTRKTSDNGIDGENWIYSGEEESGSGAENYAGYYYNVENSGEGRTARPGEGKRRKKIIEPLKELFYKVSYLGAFPKGTPSE